MRDNMQGFGLKKLNILVIGAGGFLGTYVSRALMNEGCYVIKTDAKKSINCEMLDISDADDVKKYALQLQEDRLKLDGIVNCAALSFRGKDIGSNKFIDTLKTNTQGAYNSSTGFFAVLNEQASIVNVSSIFALHVPEFENYSETPELFNNVSYGCSKSGMEYLTRYCAKLYAPLRFNCVAPGGIFQDHDGGFVKQYAKKVALKRMAKPEEVADTIMFLLSPRASYITGTVLHVDGGYGL